MSTFTKPTQMSRVLAALEEGRRLTPLDALKEFGCFRLAAVVHALRKEGYNIVTHIVNVQTREGGSTEVAEYEMVLEPQRAFNF